MNENNQGNKNREFQHFKGVDFMKEVIAAILIR
jgi:hypothetical protein